MPLDPRVRRFLDVLAASKPQQMQDTTVEERRLGLAQLMKFGGPEAPVDGLDDRSLQGLGGPLRARVYTPLDTRDAVLPGLIYFHGGGMVAGTLGTHDGIARALANSSRCRVVSIDYRLAPEHPFPAALDDAVGAVAHVAGHAATFGIDPRRLGVAGDSAGGTLAAAAVQALSRIGKPRIELQLLICPILDYGGTTPSKRELASGYLVDQATLDHDLRYYLPAGADPADPRISPLRAADLSGLPRALIHTAEFDPLRDEGRDYCQRLARARVEVSYTCHPGMIHLFYGLGGVIPYARSAFEQIGGEIRAAMG
ncbi:MAG TPA: alpha/beta hydrolase [Steroidobacteraceae bacterium]|nr:alpha/beta hydrolase [Steroidobacteraceae bacterium]